MNQSCRYFELFRFSTKNLISIYFDSFYSKWLFDIKFPSTSACVMNMCAFDGYCHLSIHEYVSDCTPFSIENIFVEIIISIQRCQQFISLLILVWSIWASLSYPCEFHLINRKWKTHYTVFWWHFSFEQTTRIASTENKTQKKAKRTKYSYIT